MGRRLPSPRWEQDRDRYHLPVNETLILAFAFFVAALLYSSVGHAGASGYLAAMALVGLAPATMKPTALALNILVATIVTIRFHLAGHVRWQALLPFVLGSIPAAFVGGALVLPAAIYKPAVGVILLVAAAQLLRTAGSAASRADRPTRIPFVPAVISGAGIGLLSGLTGTGGGIFLTPLILFAGWARARVAAGISTAFILANSISGLLGNVASVKALPPELPIWLVAVAVGALIGAELGSRRLGTPALRRALAPVLVIAGLKGSVGVAPGVAADERPERLGSWPRSSSCRWHQWRVNQRGSRLGTTSHPSARPL